MASFFDILDGIVVEESSSQSSKGARKRKIGELDFIASAVDTENDMDVVLADKIIESRNRNQHQDKRARGPGTNICQGWLSMMNLVCDVVENEYLTKQASKKIRTRLEVSLDSDWESKECYGDVRLRKIRMLLERGLKIERSEDQVEFHEAFIQACLPKIYGADWADNCVRVLMEFGIDKVKAEVMVITARRIGKTWSVAMYVLSLLLCVEGIKIAVFSTGSRASGSMYSIIMNMISELPPEEAYDRIVMNTAEELYIASQPLPRGNTKNSLLAQKLRTAKTTSQLHAYPDTVKGIYFYLTYMYNSREYPPLYITYYEERRHAVAIVFVFCNSWLYSLMYDLMKPLLRTVAPHAILIGLVRSTNGRYM